MAKKVRSRIYNNITTISENFFEHLNILWNLSNEQRSNLLDFMPKIIQSKTTRERLVNRQIAADTVGGPEQDILKAIDVLYYFSNCWNPNNDTPALVMEDFIDLGLLPEDQEKRENVLPFLNTYFEFLENDSKRLLDLSVSKMLIPSILRIDSVIDMRSVCESEFDWREDDPDVYEPIINRMIPVAILKVVCSDGDPLIFQVDYDEIDMIIKKLKVTLMEIESTRKLLK